VLEWRAIAGRAKPQAATLTLREGEILGIAGLIGAGRTEALRACFGLDPIHSGEVLVRSKEATRSTPAKRLADGIGLLSENRKAEGLMLNRSLADNLTLTRYQPLSRCGFIQKRLQKQATQDWMVRLDVRAQDPGQNVVELSGGNQQKIAIGRLLHHEASVFLLDEPTRGIDVGSKAQIYKLMGELAAQGKAIIFVSSYLPELLGICDTIGVMCRGVLSEVRPVDQWTEHKIMAAAIGQACAPE
jgi:ribose transport system ATP-binding protein